MQLSQKFEEALVYATAAHCKQSRKGTGDHQFAIVVAALDGAP